MTVQMDIGAKRWLINTARANYWRAAPWMDLDDLIQDGMLCWAIVGRKYPKVRHRGHVMRLFQTTYINYLLKLPRPIGTMLPAESADNIPEPEQCTLATLISQAPPELSAALETVANHDCRSLGNNRKRREIAAMIREFLQIGYVESWAAKSRFGTEPPS